jgi:hypothetical protein
MVFCRDIGWKEEEDAVEALEGVWSMTDIIVVATQERTESAAGPRATGMQEKRRYML